MFCVQIYNRFYLDNLEFTPQTKFKSAYKLL